MSWTFCRITWPGLAPPAASSPGRWPNLRGGCGCPAPSSWRCMPSSRDGRGCGSTIRDAPLELAPGDVALVRGGPDHHIAHEPAATCLSPEQFRARHAGDERSGDRRASVFLCGAYRFSGDVGRGLLEALPPILPLSAAADDPLHDVIALLSRELASLRSRPTDGARPAPGRPAGARDARVFPAECACASLVSGFGRSEAQPGIERHARRRRPPVDGARAGRRQRAVTGSVRAKLSAGTRSGAHAVPDRLAHDAGSRSSAHRRVDARADRRAHRLRLALRLRRGVPPPPRTPARPVAPTRAGPTRHQSGSARRRHPQPDDGACFRPLGIRPRRRCR